MHERIIEPIQFHIFKVAESESEVRIEPLGRKFFLTSKTCFAAFIFFHAKFCFKNSEKIHRSVFYYHKWPWIFSEFLESICVSEKSLKITLDDSFRGHHRFVVKLSDIPVTNGSKIVGPFAWRFTIACQSEPFSFIKSGTRNEFTSNFNKYLC